MCKLPDAEILKHETLTWGAESEVYTGKFLDYDVVVKHRFEKKFREPAIDLMLRKNRTIQEVRLLNTAAKLNVNVPAVLHIDKTEWLIVIDRIYGKPIRELTNNNNVQIEEQFTEIGKFIGRLHANDIIHGDLTTSNIMLDNDGKLWIIDFGLGYISTQIEDKAVDLLVLKHTLRSSHYSVYELTWNSFIKGYQSEFPTFNMVNKRMNVVEDRIRYSH